MRFFRWALLLVLIAILGVAVQQTMLWVGVWGNPYESQVMPLAESDQEIALIELATSIDDWGRIVTALKLLHVDWPRINPSLPALHVDLQGAFPRRTAEVPEIVLSFANSGQHLRLRWYKISGEHDAASWVRKLQARGRPPLAIIGGGTSDRAVRLARALQETYPNIEAAAPVFLITTATAENTADDTPLIEVYPRRSFRFSFTNHRMVKSLLRFVQQTPDLWTSKAASEPQPLTMHAVAWEDERYSLDLTELFATEFSKRFPDGEFRPEGRIRYSVGGFFQPSPLEQQMVGTVLARPIKPRSLMVLPTQTVRMRRFLINLRQRSPLDARNLVILNGDAISFHNVYRDRDVLWHILDLPYSLVFFSHRNPIDRAAGFTWVKDERLEPDAFPQKTTSGTHDVLLYRDLFEAFLYAAADQGIVLDDPLKVRERLRATCWYLPPLEQGKHDPARVCNSQVHSFVAERFFDAHGNRRSYTGEHVVWVRPNFTDARVDLTSRISVWVEPRKQGAWQLVEAHDAKYNESRVEEPAP